MDQPIICTKSSTPIDSTALQVRSCHSSSRLGTLPKLVLVAGGTTAFVIWLNALAAVTFVEQIIVVTNLIASPSVAVGTCPPIIVPQRNNRFRGIIQSLIIGYDVPFFPEYIANK